MLFRSATIDREALKSDSREVSLAFASEEPVERYDWRTGKTFFEILDHSSEKSADLSRLNNSGQLIFEHDRRQKLGGVVKGSAKIGADKKSRATVKFSRSPLAEQEYQDIQDGIPRNVSFGYETLDMLRTEIRDGVEYRTYKWCAYEISLVTIEADTTVGIGRSEPRSVDEPAQEIDFDKLTDEQKNALRLKFMNPTPAPAAPIEVDENKIRTDAAAAETTRCQAILEVVDALTQLHPHGAQKFGEIARAAIKDKKPVDAVNMELLRAVPGLIEVESTDPTIGMSRREVKRFSLMKVCRELSVPHGRLTGLEKEACETAQKHLRRELSDGKAVVIPEDVCEYGRLRVARSLRMQMLQRAQSAGVFADGGALVQEEYGPMIELLRNQTVLGRAGITVIGGLVGDFILPVHTGGATAYWVSETGALSDTAATFGQKAMVPHRLGATVPFTTQFLAQASISAEDFLRNELMTAMNLKKDVAGLHGTGTNGEPLGVQNTAGINATVTFGGSAAWADIVEFETGITVDNADIGTMAFLLSAATVGKWKTILKDAVAGSGYLLEGGGENMSANGYRALRTNQISGNIAFFGVWAQLLLGGWAGLEVIVDPYALKKSGQVEITMNELCDFLARQPLAFNVSTDTAAA